MADVVPEAEEFGNDVPMDPIMEREGSEHSEELELSEAHDSEGNPDDAGENEEPAEQFNQNAEPGPAEPKHDAESSAEQSSPAKSSFDWDVYLREQNAEAAPRECFFQPETASENKFQIGKKLMIADPRGPSGSSAMFCLGTVVNVYKLWLCVRLEGLDNSHEKWIFCDDDSIQPIGDSAEDHMKLNPPIGFIHHHGTFPKFLEQHLRPDDETGESMLCPAEWFHPISESLRPARNFFRVGQKVEAIDQRSFNGKTCPATIVDTTKSQIQIHFDGWNNGYDIKEPYTTRYVMPVGWSQRNGVEISPPKSGGKSKATPATVARQAAASDQKPKHRQNVTKPAHRSYPGHHHPSSSKHVIRLSDMHVNPLQSIRRGRATKRPSSSKSGTATPPSKKGMDGSSIRSSSSSSTGTTNSSKFAYEKPSPLMALERLRANTQQPRSENSVEDKVKDLLMNAQVEQQRLAKQLSQPPATYLSASSKSSRGPPPLPGSRQQVARTSDAHYAPIKNEAEEVVSSTTTSVDSSNSGLRPLAPRPSTSQTTRDLAKVVGQIRQKVDVEERRGGSPASSTSTATPPMQAQSPLPSAAAQQRSHDILLLTKDEIPLKERIMTVYVNYSCRLGPFLDPAMVAGIRRQFGPFATHHALREAVQQLLNCSKDDGIVLNLVQPAAVTQILSVTAHCGGTPRSRFIPCVKSSADAWNYIKQLLKKMKICENFYSSTPDPCTICAPGNDLSMEQVVALSLPMKQWSIDKVATELRKLLGEAVVAKFVEQQIDGRSLGLLTTELLMSHMGLALGPALKVIDFVSSVRKAQEQQRSRAAMVHKE
ncbi:hypothetical protein Y032_0077g1125 [Ancylostoma ceylanicum]|uniref:SLED domain-containing protein n=1 Tax=Ancylostoma ceylanicum TaxID=53326 RepID=A0A016TU52_9BILA|nr:hypothetical protein Y032_0077g1125 [Ancylostoma ceylanicum]